MKSDLRTVIDTGVVVSAVLLSRSVPRQAFDLAAARGRLLVSDETVAGVRPQPTAPGCHGMLTKTRQTVMGMFNSIVADLRCPITQEVGSDTEIQIKWQVREARALTVYHLGNVLEDIEAEYDNTWIRTDYICRVCSKQTAGRNGLTYIKTDDQQRHHVFVHIDQGKICAVLTEKEFEQTGVADFVHYW